jgi:hypothetical protein
MHTFGGEVTFRNTTYPWCDADILRARAHTETHTLHIIQDIDIFNNYLSTCVKNISVVIVT